LSITAVISQVPSSDWGVATRVVSPEDNKAQSDKIQIE
jgi:hypothetical protein